MLVLNYAYMAVCAADIQYNVSTIYPLFPVAILSFNMSINATKPIKSMWHTLQLTSIQTFEIKKKKKYW